MGMQVTTLTVYALLEAAEAASEGKWLAQTAGGSFLGRQVISLAKHRGVKLVSLVRRAAQKEELLSLGYVPLILMGAPHKATLSLCQSGIEQLPGSLWPQTASLKTVGVPYVIQEFRCAHALLHAD